MESLLMIIYFLIFYIKFFLAWLNQDSVESLSWLNLVNSELSIQVFFFFFLKWWLITLSGYTLKKDSNPEKEEESSVQYQGFRTN